MIHNLAVNIVSTNIQTSIKAWLLQSNFCSYMLLGNTVNSTYRIKHNRKFCCLHTNFYYHTEQTYWHNEHAHFHKILILHWSLNVEKFIIRILWQYGTAKYSKVLLLTGAQYLTSCGVGRLAPLSNKILTISKLFICAARISGVMSELKLQLSGAKDSQLCEHMYWHLKIMHKISIFLKWQKSP